MISQLKFLAFQLLLEQDRQLFKTFCQRVEIINLHGNDSDFKRIIENIFSQNGKTIC